MGTRDRADTRVEEAWGRIEDRGLEVGRIVMQELELLQFQFQFRAKTHPLILWRILLEWRSGDAGESMIFPRGNRD